MNLSQSPASLRGRTMLLLMPLLLFPFLTLLFWAAGGGKSSDADTGKNGNGIGINTTLPDARFKKEEGTDKLSFYLQASRDSLKRRAEGERDVFHDGMTFDTSRIGGSPDRQAMSGLDYNPLPPSRMDENEAKVYQKLSRLNQVLAAKQESPRTRPSDASSENFSGMGSRKRDISLTVNEDAKDPELEQLNTMLDKIAAIQHPDNSSLVVNPKESSENRKTLPVHSRKGTTVSLLPPKNGRTPAAKAKGGFYNDNLPAPDTADPEPLTAFPALVPRTQVIISGASVQLQLQQNIEVGSTTVPKGSYLFGTAAISSERMLINIKSIRLGNNVYPVSLEVYDMDGLAGVYTPGSTTGDAVRQSSNQLTSGLGLSSLDPSIGAQAASAGVEVAKSLIGKKTKLIRITLPAGYRVLLRDSHSN